MSEAKENKPKRKRKIKEIDEVEPKLVDTFKTILHDGKIEIDFGIWKNKNTVEVVSKIILDDDRLDIFITFLVRSCMAYEHMYDKKILNVVAKQNDAKPQSSEGDE